MLFNSFVFIVLFLPITLIGYFVLNALKFEKISKTWLVFASILFYAYFKVSYVILIISSIIVNYSIGYLFHKEEIIRSKRKAIFVLGCLFNLGTLGYFKYYDFFIENINLIFSSDFQMLNLLLPLGISFFTFQQLSFLIGTYKRETLEYDFLSYCLFVTFFPQLIAGPIVLPSEMLPQFESHENKKINYENMNKGLYLFSIGLAKKIVIADSIATFANVGFDQMTSLTFFEAWISSISYTLQLYFDFSGYCDMAMGIALFFNVLLPLNFDSPYKSTNIQEFWRKWHITLGRFFTRYLYIPLGGNRINAIKTIRNLSIVFLASGLWHGAGWTFVIWGALHGISIMIHRIWKSTNLRMNSFLGWAITLFCVNLYWVFFRASDFSSAMRLIKGLLNIGSFSSYLTEAYSKQLYYTVNENITFTILVLSLFLVLFSNNSYEKAQSYRYSFQTSVEKICYMVSSVLLLNRVVTFLYFNF